MLPYVAFAQRFNVLFRVCTIPPPPHSLANELEVGNIVLILRLQQNLARWAVPFHVTPGSLLEVDDSGHYQRLNQLLQKPTCCNT